MADPNPDPNPFRRSGDKPPAVAPVTVGGRPRTPPPLRIPELLRANLVEAAADGYPNEVCGLLIGRETETGAGVHRWTIARNLARERLADRYVLAPDDFNAADRAARGAGLEIVGIWHTHPDHPARPSATDLEAAWPGYSYVILSVVRGRVEDVTSWRLADERFVRQSIEETRP